MLQQIMKKTESNYDKDREQIKKGKESLKEKENQKENEKNDVKINSQIKLDKTKCGKTAATPFPSIHIFNAIEHVSR